jgi:hypothetical protein
LIPISPDWRGIANALHARYRSYTKLQDALAERGAIVDHATLSRLCTGKAKRLTWETGAALLNLYAQIKE